MSLFIEIITTVAPISIIHIYLSGFFDLRDRPLWIWISVYFVYGLCLTLLSFLTELCVVRLLYNASATIAIAYFFFRSKLLQSVYAGISISAILILSEIITVAIFSLLGLSSTSLMEYDTARSICASTSLTIGLVLVLLILLVIKRKHSAVSLSYIFMLLPGYVISILLGYALCQIVINSSADHPLFFLLSAAGLTYLNIWAAFYAERVRAVVEKQKELTLIEHHYALQEQYYEQLRNEQDDVRALFHDINKYMRAMRALALVRKSTEAEQVLADAQSLFDNLGIVVDVGNSVISVILSDYLRKTKELGIVFTYDVSVRDELNMTASDLYILLGNTLDNALEACRTLEPAQRSINLKLRLTQDILFYQLRNTFVPSNAAVDKGKLHGYGLKSVRKCVEKYAGNLTITEESNFFTIVARLNV